MAAPKLSPPPLGEDQGIWNVWFLKVKDVVNNISNALKWTALDFTGSKLTDVQTRNHNDLQSLQGGSTTERYHLTAAQNSGLTGGGVTSLHTHVYTGSGSLTFGSIAANGIASATVTVTGAVAGKSVMLGPPAAIEASLTWSGYVSAADTVTIRLHNTSGGSVTPATATWNARVEV